MVALVDRSHAAATSSIPNTRVVSMNVGQGLVLAGVLVLVLTVGLTLLSTGLLTPASSASVSSSSPSQSQFHTYASSSSNSTGVTDKSILALAAAVAIAGGLIGTGMAQSGIGASGMGIIAERPEKFGQVLVFFVIPETLWILGFVLGIVLLLQIL